MQVLRLAEMCSPDIRAALDDGIRTIVLPLGSTEQHGPHLPVAMDTMVVDALAERVAAHFAPAFIGPCLSVGSSDHHLDFAGTVSLRPDTLVTVLLDCLYSLNRHGFEEALMVSYHGGNFAPMARAKAAFEEVRLPMKVAAFTDTSALVRAGETAAARLHGIAPEAAGAHAGHVETSVALALVPHLVGPQRDKGFVGSYREISPLLFAKGLKAVTANGVLGDPDKASAEAGKEYLDAVFAVMVEHLEQQLGMQRQSREAGC